MAREKGVDVDEARFLELMQEQKERARAAGKFNIDQSQINEWQIVEHDDDHSEFVGYDDFESSCSINAYRKEGERFAFTLNKTLYAESGGQVADTGLLTNGEEFIHVIDVQKGNGFHIHYTEQLPSNLAGVWTAKLIFQSD